MSDARFSLAGRVALVTGGGSGLGRHFARVLAEAGARVAVGGRRRAALEETVGAIASAGGDGYAVTLDVTAPDSVVAAFDTVADWAGDPDVVINNAGVASAGRTEAISEQDWHATIDTNLGGVQRVAGEAARRWIAAGRPGRIVNVASALGIGVSAGTAAYNASKAAVIQLPRPQALEWARHGIAVNALCPGYFPTDLNAGFLETPAGRDMVARIPMGRVGHLEELSGPLLLLASPAGGFMTGSQLVVDGGHLCMGL